ncbi:MAG: hypothetical protein QXL43_04820 [Methanolinea sp.]
MILVRQEKIALALVIAVLVSVTIASILVESAGKEAFARPFSQDSREGELVFHGGTVEDARTTQAGGHQVLRVGGVRVFVPSHAARRGWPRAGDSVFVVGTVQIYRGEKEILVQSPGDIRPIASP